MSYKHVKALLDHLLPSFPVSYFIHLAVTIIICKTSKPESQARNMCVRVYVHACVFVCACEHVPRIVHDCCRKLPHQAR